MGVLEGSPDPAAPPRSQGAPVALTRWLRSYSAIFSISSFIFSMFCFRRSSHSLLGGGGEDRDRHTQGVRKNYSI